MEDLIVLHLNPEQAKHYVMLQFLESIGVFKIRNGQVVINFNDLGQIRDVTITNHYKAKQEFLYPPLT